MGSDNKKARTRVLLVAPIHSIHTARWVQQVIRDDREIHIVSSMPGHTPNPALKNVIYHVRPGDHLSESHGFKTQSILWIFPYRKSAILRLFGKILLILYRGIFSESLKATSLLERTIKKIKPDIIHSLEFQHAGYLVLNWKESSVDCSDNIWITTNWGSDIYLFQNFPEHYTRIKRILEIADFYSCECKRDVEIAKQIGLKSKALPIIPNAGGFDLAKLKPYYRQPTSTRKLIMLKGYQHWAGRALIALTALESVSECLSGYTVCIYSSGEDVNLAARLFEIRTRVKVQIESNADHERIMQLHGQARISIGLSISDGISTSFLEALVMGSFPIQSNSSCANEWIEDGVTGSLVPAEDSKAVADAIKNALENDVLVDSAASANYQTARERLDESVVSAKAERFYDIVLNDRSEI